MMQGSAPNEGSLTELPLSDLLAAHARARTSGRLVVRTTAGDGELRLWDGSVAEARFGPAEGETALMRLIAFREGTFSFEARPVTNAGLPSGELQGILEKARSHQDEVEKHAARLGGLMEVFELDLGTYARRRDDIPGEINPVMSLVDGRRSVLDIVSASDIPDVTVLRVLRKLRSMGLLRTHAEAVEAQRKQDEATAAAVRAAATPAATPAPEQPKSFEEMLLVQFQQKQDEHAALLEMAVPESMRSLPPRPQQTAAEIAERARAADAFAGPDISTGPNQAAPSIFTAPPPPSIFTAPPPERAPSVAADPQAAPKVVVPTSEAVTQPGPPAPPAPTGKDAIRLKKSGATGPLDVDMTRWTDRPESRSTPPGEDDTEDELPSRDVTPLSMAAAARITQPEMPAFMTPGMTPGMASRQEFSPESMATTPPAGMPARAQSPSPAVARGAAEDDHFFARASNEEALAALAAEQDAASLGRDGSKFFLYVIGGVAAVAALLVVATMASSPAPAVESPVEQPVEQEKPGINVMAGEMGAQVKTGEQALREISRAEAAKDLPPPKDALTPAQLAAELAGEPAPVEKPVEAAPPVEKPVEKAAAPVEKAAAPVEKAPVAVAKPAEKPTPKPVEKAAAPVEKPVEKAAAPAEDPKKQFNERFERGVRFLKAENHDEAKRAFESALKIDPGSGRAYTSLGQVNYELGNLDEALKLLRKGEALEPSYAATYLVMGLLQQERGEDGAAEKAFERYLTLSPNGKDATTVRNFLAAAKARKAKK